MKGKNADPQKAVITHTMANGEVRNTLEGYKIDIDKVPEIALKLFYQIAIGK